MTQLIATNSITAIVGLGVTGLSVARFLEREGRTFVMLDSRENPPQLQAFLTEFPTAAIELGPLNIETLCAASDIVLSPGLALTDPAIQAALAAKVPVVGDIDLFAKNAKAPIIAITGSNAKSTVTTLVGLMAERAGINVGVGGNIGIPALDLLQGDGHDLYVLELSSFQLETTKRLAAKVATILNVSLDHMDRYDGLPQYHGAKQRIYFGAEQVVVNRADALTQPPLMDNVPRTSFGLNNADFKQFGVSKQDDGDYLSWQFQPLLAISELKIRGSHNVENALAALALGKAAGIPMDAMLETLRDFSGLAHRCQWLANINDVDYYNDSKGTNVGATLAAIDGLAAADSKLILIAGGVGKGADFKPLANSLAKHCRALVLIGADANKIAEITPANVTVEFADSLPDAIDAAARLAQSGDSILLSPACASFDMFSGFEQRGDVFAEKVKSLAGEINE